MDEELKNLKKYLYVLCEKIAGIKTINAGNGKDGKDGKDAFTKEYKLYFLLFVHRISGYEKLKTITGLPTITELDLINKINGLIKDKENYKKSQDLIDAEALIETHRELIMKDLKFIEKPKNSKVTNEYNIFKKDNKVVLDKIREANKIVKNAKEVDFDYIIRSLLLYLLDDTNHEIKSIEDLNDYLYKTTNKQSNGKFRVEDEIDKVKKQMKADADLTQYFSFINTIIHTINPINQINPPQIQPYVNKYFDDKESLGVPPEDLQKIRKAFMIYLINNIIYYYIILKYDESTCDDKIRFIFSNRYIKFSKIDMVAPQTNDQYTVLNNDIIEIFRNRTLLFDLTNNIIHYEHKYLSNCDDYNKSIITEGSGEVFENAKALSEYNEISTEYKAAYAEYIKAYDVYKTAYTNHLRIEKDYAKVLADYKKLNANYLKDRKDEKNKKLNSDAEANKTVAEKKKTEADANKTTAENNLRNAVYKFNEDLFCCFSKYIEIHFKKRIIGITDKHKETISTYVDLIKNYIESCNGKECSITYTDVKQEKDLNSLKDRIESVMTEQITSLFLAHAKDSKDTMNDSINMVVEIEKNIQGIYDELLYPSNPPTKTEIEFLEDKYKKGIVASIMKYNQMMREIISKLKAIYYYNNKALSTIYETLQSIVNKIGIPSLTFDTLKGCCLTPLFMDKNTFIGEDNTNISSIIYDKAFEDIERLIEVYKEKHSNTLDSTNRHKVSVEYSIKITEYLALVEEIKQIEIVANEKKLEALELLESARKKARDAYERTERTKGKIDAIGNRIFNRIRIAQEALTDEEEKYKRYLKLLERSGQVREIRYDTEVERGVRLKDIEKCKENIKSIEDKKIRLDVLIKDAFRVAMDAKHKAYIYENDEVKLADLVSIEDIITRLNNATTDAGDAIRNNEEADEILKEIEKLLDDISPKIILTNGLTINIRKLFNEDEIRKQEDEKRKNEANDSVSKAIAVADAIGFIQNKHEDEQRKIEEEDNKRKRDANDSVSKAIEVGKAIGVVQDTHEDEERKNEAIEGVRVATRVGKAIRDAQDKHEEEERKNEAIDGVRVAINVGKAIRDAQDKHEEEERKKEEDEQRKREAIDGVDVATRVGDAIRDAQNKHEDEQRKREAIDGVDVAIDVGDAIRDAQDKHEDEERKREAIDGVDVAIDVGKAIGVVQDKHEEEERKQEAIEGVSVAIDVGDAIGVVQDTYEEEEQRKNEANDSVGVAIDVGDAIGVVKDIHEEEEQRKNDGVGVAIEVGKAIDDARNNQEEVVVEEAVNDPESESEDEEDDEAVDEPEPNVSDVQETPVIVQPPREYKIDDEVLKGRYLATGLFKEAKDEDIRMARDYQMEQVRNRYNKKRGSINEMSAAIDEYNYPQMGGGSGGSDMIHKLNRFENDINNPIEAFEIKFEDRLVFIIATFFIRYVSMSIIQRGIDSNMVKSFYEGFIYYGVIYILLFWFIVLFINIDNNYTIDYIEINNLAIYIRSIFYYFYMGTNGISRLAIHTLLILVIIIIPIILNIKNGKAKDTADTLNDDEEDKVKLLPLEERTKLSKALSLFTLFIWILTSIIASKF